MEIHIYLDDSFGQLFGRKKTKRVGMRGYVAALLGVFLVVRFAVWLHWHAAEKYSRVLPESLLKLRHFLTGEAKMWLMNVTKQSNSLEVRIFPLQYAGHEYVRMQMFFKGGNIQIGSVCLDYQWTGKMVSLDYA